jgi:Zn finger protein HypA/HybF involved in hydrogenase expression
MSVIVPLHRTLEQELQALARNVSLECLVCGEFLLRRGRALACPECGSMLTDGRGLRVADGARASAR